MLAAILAIALLFVAGAIIGVWVWAVRRVTPHWLVTLLSGIVAICFASAFVFFAGLLTLF